ncbi:MAG: chloride channel protein, partial [Verrucomicrobiaceae bacterium]|nr:chloride channel protein [Verrucomicrobiaceae bacterium]
NKLFQKTAENYALPSQVKETVEAMSDEARQGTVANVMSADLTTISAGWSINQAIDEFQKHPHSVYPVLDADGKVLGLLRRSAAYEWLKNHGLDCEHKISELPLVVPFKVTAETKVVDMMEDFMHSGATKAVVMDAEGKLKGMVTVFDLLKGR